MNQATEQNEATETTKDQHPAVQLRAYLERTMRAEIAKALPKDIDPDRFIRTIVSAVQMNEDLALANRRSLLGACMRAAQDGLMPDGREAVLNIYNTKVKKGNSEEWVQTVQYLPMVRGILKVIRNSGEVAHIDAAAVYEKEIQDFVFERGDNAKLVHRPYLGADDPGPVVAAYMVVRLNNGEVHREVLSRRDIEKVRAASKSPNGPMWKDWYDQAAIKAVIKRGSKLLPQSSDRLTRVLEHDNEAMGFNFDQRGASLELAPPPAAQALPNMRPSRMASIIGQAKQEMNVQPEASLEPVAQEASS